MAGVSLARAAMPVFVIGSALAGLCLWLNVAMAPKAKDTMKFVLYEAVKQNPNAMLDPGVVQTRLKGQKIFIEEREGDTLNGLHIYHLDEENPTHFPTRAIYAREAKLKIINETKQIRLNLTDATIDSRDPDGNREMPSIGEWEPLLFDFTADRKKRRKASTMTNSEIRDRLASGEEKEASKRYNLKNEIHRRYAFSCACLALALVAVPLGINARRKETSTGLAISIGVGLGYFLFFMIAAEFQKKEGNTAIILFWLPNFVCLILSIFLFSRARRK
ncbi:MAG: LptF/LptG family permease, partial [Akkermansiaceae bacterium]